MFNNTIKNNYGMKGAALRLELLNCVNFCMIKDNIMYNNTAII